MKPPATAPIATWVDDPPTYTIITTAPSAAPALKPMMSGDPSGLRTSAWKIAPDMPNAAPTPMATSTRGSRSVPTMNSESAVGLPEQRGDHVGHRDREVADADRPAADHHDHDRQHRRTRRSPAGRGVRRTSECGSRVPRIGQSIWRRRRLDRRRRDPREIGDHRHSCAIRVRRTRSTNTGPPMAAVMMPTWISPGRAMIRPAVSQ